MAQVKETTNKTHIYDVEIAGISLKLKSEKDAAVVKKLISFVDKRIADALPATKSGSVQNAALLALLNLAEEFSELKTTALMKLEKFEKKTLKIIEDIESSTKAGVRSEKASPADNKVI